VLTRSGSGAGPGAPPTHPELAAALGDCRRAFWSVAAFSSVVNILMLAGPLYMLQVYDRVLTSRSVPTLIALTMLLVGAYGFQACLDVIRSRIVVRAAQLLDQRLASVIHNAVMQLSVRRSSGDAQQPVRDLDAIRSFLTSAGPTAIVDLPWVPFFLIICVLIHPIVGAVAAVGAVVLFCMTLLTERTGRVHQRRLGQEGTARMALADASRRNSETAFAMGMADVLSRRWVAANDRYIESIGRSSDVVGGFGSISKVLRLLLQSIMLGTGAYLVIKQELTSGAMIASSIMMGRALAPIETAIANWRGCRVRTPPLSCPSRRTASTSP
jgi:ATP-binding cassette subfamily C protein